MSVRSILTNFQKKILIPNLLPDIIIRIFTRHTKALLVDAYLICSLEDRKGGTELNYMRYQKANVCRWAFHIGSENLKKSRQKKIVK